MIFYENLQLVNKPFHDEFKKQFSDVLESGWFILGKQVEKFEQEFAEYISAKYCVGVGNGLDALTIHLLAWNFESDAEVIVPSNTYIATILAVLRAGLKPVLVEPCPQTYNITAEHIEKKITKKTKVILSVHLYGKACPITEINELASSYGLKTLEDCAQAHGASDRNFRAGSQCDAGAFSFYPTKNLGCLGDGGAITTNDKDFFNKLKMLRNYGSQKKYVFDAVGLNSRLDEMQAAFLRVKLKYLDEINSHKRYIASIYDQEIKDHVVKPVKSELGQDVFHIYNIRSKNRDQLQSFLKSRGVLTEIHYPVAPHHQKAMDFLIGNESFPMSEEIHRTTLSLPISTATTVEDAYKVAQVVNNFA